MTIKVDLMNDKFEFVHNGDKEFTYTYEPPCIGDPPVIIWSSGDELFSMVETTLCVFQCINSGYFIVTKVL